LIRLNRGGQRSEFDIRFRHRVHICVRIKHPTCARAIVFDTRFYYSEIFFLLDSEKSATVKMEMVVVEVKGMKAGAKTVVVSYKTNGKQNVVNFSFNPQTVWNAGKYKINVLINGKQSASKEFEIIKPSEVKSKK
jgi:hypothetical protein